MEAGWASALQVVDQLIVTDLILRDAGAMPDDPIGIWDRASAPSLPEISYRDGQELVVAAINLVGPDVAAGTTGSLEDDNLSLWRRLYAVVRPAMPAPSTAILIKAIGCRVDQLVASNVS